MLAHIPALITILISLVLLSIFFSLAETAMFSINRYRLRHMAKKKHKRAKYVSQLLERPDRLLGVILLCDTFADILASAIATLIAIHYLGDSGVIPATLIMTSLVLIFGEIAPKTLAAHYPEPIAFFAAWPLIILLKVLYPLVWLSNVVANGTLRLFGIKVGKRTVEHFSHEELATILQEAGGKIPADYLGMLNKVLSLEKVSVEDIMIPRNEITGIDLADDWDLIVEQVTKSQYAKLPVYLEDINNVLGMLYLRKALSLLADDQLTKDNLTKVLEDVYFVPEGTPLNTQLINFKHVKQRIGLVVNEYGDILGLVTLEDILEEIVGEFTTDIAEISSRLIHSQPDGSYLVDGGINIRDLNQALHCKLPVSGPKTLSGLLIEYLETIPQSATALRFGKLVMEIVQVKNNVIKKVRILTIRR